MLDTMDIDTGLDIEALLRLRAKVAAWLDGESLHGALWRAGLPRSVTADAAPAACMETFGATASCHRPNSPLCCCSPLP